MRCVAPGCDLNDPSSNSAQGITFFQFPAEPTLRAVWLERLHMTDWQPEDNSTVCSKHFLPDDIVDYSNGLPTLRNGAMPIATVEVCRICLAMDCKLYTLTAYNTLYKAYETLTGLLIQSDNIPPYLCNKCAHQLLKCARFRNKSIEAHSVLKEIYSKHKCITLESIKSIHGMQNVASNEAHDPSDRYDIDKEVVEMENSDTVEQTDTITPVVSPAPASVDCIKSESHERLSQGIVSNKSLTKNVMVHIAVDQALQEDLSMDSCKTEDNDAMNQDEDSEVLKSKDSSKEIVEGVAMDDDPPLEDISQEDDSNNEYQDVWVVIEEESLTKDDSSVETVVIGEENPTKEDTSSEMEPEERPTEGHITIDIELDVGNQNTRQTVDEQALTNIPEQDVTNIQNLSDMAYDSIQSEEAEGHSLPLREVNQETGAGFTRVQEVEIFIEKAEYTNDDLSRNLDSISSQENAKLTCDKCPFQCNTKVQMTSHLKAHAAPTSYNCSLCNYKTIHRRSLAWHARVHSGERPFQCEKCNKTFSQVGSLRVHMRQHSGKKPYSCNVCKRKFTDFSTLRRHLIIHTGEKPYVCDICNKAFRQVGNLRSHLRMHTGEKSFVCDYCNKAFGQKVHLIKHMRIHTDDLRYACPICNKIYRRDVTFENHMRKHYSKKSYSCEVCKKVFSQRSCLRVHWKKHT